MDSGAAHILVTCTKRKRREVPSRLRLGSITQGTPREVARRWIQRLEKTTEPRIRATSLYAGDHWNVAASLPSAAAAGGVKANLWVLSAGYGLIPGSVDIAPYSATFSIGHPDEIVARFNNAHEADAMREWWTELSKWAGPRSGTPRTIAKLAQQHPSVPIVVVASPKYLSATQDDLLSARSKLSNPNNLIVVSAGSRGRGPLAENMIDCSARLQSVLGGALMSLNARVARILISNRPPYPWTVKGFQEFLEKLPMSEPESSLPQRHAVSDDDVRKYVESTLLKDPKARHTTLLRLYREAGFACEQKRFARLFKEVEARHAGTK